MRPPTKMTRDDGRDVEQPTRRLTPGEARRWLVRHGGDRAYQPNAGHAEVAENSVGFWSEWSCRFSGWPQGRINPRWFGVLTYRKPVER
jgi:hypothetical protein